MPTWSRTVTGLILCLGLFPAFLEILFSSISELNTHFDLGQIVTFSNLSIQVVDLKSERAAGPHSSLAWSLVLIAGGLTFVFRDTVAFVFFVFHLALTFFCAILDTLVFVALPDKNLLVERAVTFSLFVVLLSQVAFLSFHNPSVVGTIRLILSIFISSLAFVTGCILLGFLAQTSDGTLLVFLTYIILSYGVFGLHIASLTLVMNSPDEN